MMKVLVIDDSALMRKYLRQIIEVEPGFEVITARDGEDGLEKIKRLNPDVVTLDINMPVMDGLTCLSHIMAESPRPVIMISSLTEKGALATFEALELGAVDYVAKPGGTVSINLKEAEDEIRAKVRVAAGASTNHAHGLRERLRSQRTHPAQTPPTQAAPARANNTTGREGLVLIGVSTGGPTTLESIITALPGALPWPILVAQHMPARFTSVFAQRLDKSCALNVREVSRPTPLAPGEVLIARGNADITVGKRGNRRVAISTPIDSSHTWHPSVARMVSSALEHYEASQLICIQLTGMGDDGAVEMARAHQQGSRTIAEAEQTAIVYGMPRALVELDGADEVLPMDRIADRLRTWLTTSRVGMTA